jgi:hypothetical protein
MIYDAVMILNIFQKVCLPSYVNLFTFTAPSGSTADTNVITEYSLLQTDKMLKSAKIRFFNL